MQLALAQAVKAEKGGEVPVGAVIVNEKGKVIAEAGNMPITLNDPTAHAEILALRKAGKLAANYRLTGATLYVTIEPCPMCAGALVNARIKRIVYGADDPKAGSCGTAMNIACAEVLNHQIEITKGVLASECRKVMQNFFKKKREQKTSTGEVPKRS